MIEYIFMIIVVGSLVGFAVSFWADVHYKYSDEDKNLDVRRRIDRQIKRSYAIRKEINRRMDAEIRELFQRRRCHKNFIQEIKK